MHRAWYEERCGAEKLWEQIETFAAYGFGKAHAASYGNLAYKTAYMKANFPVDYMAAVLTTDAGDVEKSRRSSRVQTHGYPRLAAVGE